MGAQFILMQKRDESYTIWDDLSKLTLIQMYQAGDPWLKISIKLGRSISACKQRMYSLRSAKRNIEVLAHVDLNYSRRGKR